MYYVVDYEICALLFLLVLLVRYFGERQFPGRLSRFFGIILLCAAADLALDILGSIIIEYAEVYPGWVVHGVNTAFYTLQILFPVLMLRYVLLMLGVCWERARGLRWLYLPAILLGLGLVSNVFTDAVFYLDAQGVYMHGPLFPFLYVNTAFYMLVTLYIICKRRRELSEAQFSTIAAFLLVVAAAAAIQVLLPAYLLTGVGITLAIMMMYFILQNPENMRDEMTGTFNHGALLYLLRDCAIWKTPFYVIALEIGDMRRINNLFGLDVGNRAMAGVGAFLQEYGGQTWAFHSFGARFVVIAYTREDYTALPVRIRERFAAPWTLGDVTIPLTATVRSFSNEDVSLNAENVIKLVDAAFVEAEEPGEDDFVEIAGQQAARLRRRIAVEEALRAALAQDGKGFSLCFQPLYSVRADRFTRAEVLLRFTGEGVGTVSPGEFIPIAEKGGLIPALDQLVLEQSCAFIARCAPQEAGLEGLQINLSAAEFLTKDLPDRIRTTVARYKTAPSLLLFEITETAATARFSVLKTIMGEICDDGFRLVLDDFGAGYANLTQVMSLPFSQVKLDQSLLRAACEEQSVMLASMADMLRKLGLETLVEGVESAWQAETAMALGVHYIQGYHYALPMPEEAFMAFLRARQDRA